MTGYCPNCGGAVEHDGDNAECAHCDIRWMGNARHALKPEPYEPGELEAHHAAATARHFPNTQPSESVNRAPIV